MKVLFVSHTPVKGGANLAMLDLIESLRPMGIEAAVIVPRDNYKDGIYGILKEKGIECYQYKFIRLFCFRWDKYLRNLIYIPYLFFKMRKLKFDIVHSNSSCTGLGLYISWLHRKPHIWHIRENWWDWNIRPTLGFNFTKWLFLKAHKTTFVAISDYIIRAYVEHGFVRREQIERIYNGIRIGNVLPLQNNNIKCINIVFLGGYAKVKRVMDLIRAVKVLSDSGVDSFKLCVYGNQECMEYSECSKLVSSLELDDKVRLKGYIDDISIVLSQMHIGVMATRGESFGRVTVEYMMHGLVTIASDSGANLEIIENGKTGFIYKTGDCADLAEKIKYAIENYAALQDMRSLAQEAVRNRFDIEGEADAFARLYRRIVS